MQTPPTQASESHLRSEMSPIDLAESKSSASRSSASLLDDGGPSAETPQENVFTFRNITFQDVWDVCTSFDLQQQPEMEVKESATTKMKNSGDSEPQESSFKSYHWAPSTPIPGMMQTLDLVPLPKKDIVEECVLPFSQGLPERVLALTIVTHDNRRRTPKQYHFQTKILCQLNPLMLPVMEVRNGTLPSEAEWKLRDVISQRKEKLKVLILLFCANVKTVLFSLGRLKDLLSDVATVVLENPGICSSVYVIDLTSSRNRLNTIEMLLKTFTFEHDDEESFVRAISACISQNESWHVVEATVEIGESIHEFVSTYPKFPNLYFSSDTARSMNCKVKNKLSDLVELFDTQIDLSEFPNLGSLLCFGRFVNSPLQQSHGLRYLDWNPSNLTRFNDFTWGCLSNLQCLHIHGSKLQSSSRISFQCFPKLISLHVAEIEESIVVDFGHLPLRLVDLELLHFQGSLEGSDELQIETLLFSGPVCSNAYLQLCPKCDKVEINVGDIDDACRPLSLVADQLKCLKLSFCKRGKSYPVERFPFSSLGKGFPLLESLELINCSVVLAAATFPRLHHLSVHKCDVFFPGWGVAGLYGDSFPEIESLAITHCKLLHDGAVPDDHGQDPVGVIHLQANSLCSLKLIDVANLKMLRIHRKSFPCLQRLHCHVANDDDFPFSLDKPEAPFFPHLRNLSLRKNALDGKKINLDLLADMGRLEKLELLDNAFFTVDDMKPIPCRWVHFSSAVVKHENAGRFPAGMPIPMESSAEMETFATSLVSEQCEKLIIDQDVVCLSDRHLAQSNCNSLPMLPVQKQTPPNQAAKAHPIAKKSHGDLAESKSSPASKSAASSFSLDDGGPSAEMPQDDMFIFSDTTLQDLWDVCDGFDFQEQPEVEIKEPTITKMNNDGDSGRQESSFRSYRLALSTPIPGMIQTIGLLPVTEECHVGQSALPVFQSLPERVLGLPIVAWDNRNEYGRPYFFRSRFLCQLNPLMLPVMKAKNADHPSDEEWKLRDVLAKRTEKLRVLILLFDEGVKTVLSLLERLEDLLSDVTTVVFGDACSRGSVYVIDLAFSENRLNILAMLLKSFTFRHDDEESFVKVMSACNAEIETWRVIEATVKFDSSLHALVSAYPESPNIHFASYLVPSMNRKMKNELSNLDNISGTPIDLSDFRNLRSLLCHGRFLNSPLNPSHGLRHLDWFPFEMTRFNDCAWGCLSNLQCFSIDGSKLQPNSRIVLQRLPKLVSLCLTGIAKNVVIDFGHIPLRLNDLQLHHFQGSLEGSDELQIKTLVFSGPVCSNASLQLCPISEKIKITVGDNDDACRPLSLVADQLKCMKLFYRKLKGSSPLDSLPFNTLDKIFLLLESLELVCCDVVLSAVIFPHLHHLSLDGCDVLLPKYGIVDQYGDSFPELCSLAMTNCKLLLDGADPDGDGQDSVGVIHLQANMLSSLKLINVSNLKMLQIQKQSFPRLQNLHCHVVDDDDFPFTLNIPGEPFFPLLRNLSLKKNALDGKMINLNLLADMGKLERLELLDNAFFTRNDMMPIQCRWVHFSSAVLKHENAGRLPAGMPNQLDDLTDMVIFAVRLVGEHCEKLTIDRHLCLFRDQANMKKRYPPMFGFRETLMSPTKMMNIFVHFYGGKEKRCLIG